MQLIGPYTPDKLVVRLSVDEMSMKKRPTCMKRDLYIYEKRPTKETHTRDARTLFTHEPGTYLNTQTLVICK